MIGEDSSEEINFFSISWKEHKFSSIAYMVHRDSLQRVQLKFCSCATLKKRSVRETWRRSSIRGSLYTFRFKCLAENFSFQKLFQIFDPITPWKLPGSWFVRCGNPCFPTTHLRKYLSFESESLRYKHYFTSSKERGYIPGGIRLGTEPSFHRTCLSLSSSDHLSLSLMQSRVSWPT